MKQNLLNKVVNKFLEKRIMSLFMLQYLELKWEVFFLENAACVGISIKEMKKI